MAAAVAFDDASASYADEEEVAPAAVVSEERVEKLTKIFELLDIDGSGTLHYTEFMLLGHAVLGREVTKEEAVKEMSKADNNGFYGIPKVRKTTLRMKLEGQVAKQKVYEVPQMSFDDFISFGDRFGDNRRAEARALWMLDQVYLRLCAVVASRYIGLSHDGEMYVARLKVVDGKVRFPEKRVENVLDAAYAFDRMVVKFRTLKNPNGRSQTKQKMMNCTKHHVEQDEWFEMCTWTKKELQKDVALELEAAAKLAADLVKQGEERRS